MLPSTIATPAVMIGEECRYCHKWTNPGDLIRFGVGLSRCLQCQERHLAALDVMAGKTPAECAFCKLSWSDLCEQFPGEHVPMVVHYLDGTYVLACQKCDVVITQLTRDLFKGTRFGAERRL